MRPSVLKDAIQRLLDLAIPEHLGTFPAVGVSSAADLAAGVGMLSVTALGTRRVGVEDASDLLAGGSGDRVCLIPKQDLLALKIGRR